MVPILLGVLALSAALCIAADHGRRRPAFYLLKPLTTVLVIALAVSAGGLAGYFPRAVVLALVLCLAGDVLLMSPSRRAFGAGVGSFLLAHGFLIQGAVQSMVGSPPPVAVLVLLPLALFAAWSVAGHGRAGLIAYAVMLLLMAVVLSLRGLRLDTGSAWMAAAGAWLFALSDAALAWRKFRRDFAGAQALVLSTYWAGLALIALSLA
jgi:alkenylglycerophosphocholine hydrolase